LNYRRHFKEKTPTINYCWSGRSSLVQKPLHLWFVFIIPVWYTWWFVKNNL